MNYHPKHKSNSRTAVWIGAGVLAAVAIGAIIFITITLRTPMTKEEARAKAGIVYDSSATEGGWDLPPKQTNTRSMTALLTKNPRFPPKLPPPARSRTAAFAGHWMKRAG